MGLASIAHGQDCRGLFRYGSTQGVMSSFIEMDPVDAGANRLVGIVVEADGAAGELFEIVGMIGAAPMTVAPDRRLGCFADSRRRDYQDLGAALDEGEMALHH